LAGFFFFCADLVFAELFSGAAASGDAVDGAVAGGAAAAGGGGAGAAAGGSAGAVPPGVPCASTGPAGSNSKAAADAATKRRENIRIQDSRCNHPTRSYAVRARAHTGIFVTRTGIDCVCLTRLQLVKTKINRLHCQSGPSAAFATGSGVEAARTMAPDNAAITAATTRILRVHQ